MKNKDIRLNHGKRMNRNPCMNGIDCKKNCRFTALELLEPSVLQHIFSYLNNRELYESTLTLSKHLHDIAWCSLDKSIRGNYPIKWASATNRVFLLQRLLKDEGVDPSTDQNAPLLLACEKGYLDIVKCLLMDNRVDPSQDGCSSLLIACQKGHLSIVKELIDSGRLDISPVYELAMHIAKDNGHVDIVRLLKKESSIFRPLIWVLNVVTIVLLAYIILFPESVKKE